MTEINEANRSRLHEGTNAVDLLRDWLERAPVWKGSDLRSRTAAYLKLQEDLAAQSQVDGAVGRDGALSPRLIEILRRACSERINVSDEDHVPLIPLTSGTRNYDDTWQIEASRGGRILIATLDPGDQAAIDLAEVYFDGRWAYSSDRDNANEWIASRNCPSCKNFADLYPANPTPDKETK